MKNWWNKYVGIPYKLHGRDTDGLDCWGLVRLVYKDEKSIDLPSLSQEYYSSDNFKQNEEVISNNNENWYLSEDYTVGDVVLFRINGAESHVGIVIDENRFLHSKEGVGVTIEKLNSNQWRKRIAGFYKYNNPVEAYIHAAMHPLKTARLDLIASPGQTLQEIVDSLQTKYGINSKIFNNHILFLDGYPIAKEQWSDIRLKEGQHVDYRVVPTGSGSGRLLATLALVAVAWWAAPYIAGAALGVGGAGVGAAGYGALGAAVTAGSVTAGSVALATSLATMGINVVGGLLINAIFPVRENKSEPVQFRNTNLLQGGSNQENPYGAIPVVLGRVRYTPPLGAKTFIENSGDTSYMRMLAVWGYGPLQISNMRLGNVPLEYYDEIEHQTLYGTDDDTTEAVRTFDSIYGRDITQQAPNHTLTCQRQLVSSVTVTNNDTFTVTINGQGDAAKVHGLQLNDPIQTLFYYTSITIDPETSEPIGTLIRVDNLVVTDIINDTEFVCTVSSGSYANGTYSDQTSLAFKPYFIGGNPYFETNITQDVDRISVTLALPQGLYGVREENGSTSALDMKVSIQIRPVGETSWNEASEKISGRTFNFSKAYYNIDNDAELEKVYQWHYVNIDSNGKAVIRSGSITNNKTSNPSGTMLQRLQQLEGVGFDDMSFNYLPSVQSQEETMYKICVYGDNITDVIDNRSTAAITGCDSSIAPGTGLTAGLSLSFDDGVIVRINETDPYYDLSKGSFIIKDIVKYGYSKTIYFNVSRGPYEIRVKRTSSNTHLTDQIMDTCVLAYITGYTYVRPISLPKDSFGDTIKVARTAMKIRATGQISGQVEGVTATVQTLGEDYVDGAWIDGLPIRNPAALFRHVLKHQGNAKSSSVQIDESSIAEWYTYCKTNNFNFDTVVLEQKSLLEILKDIAAAGRGSPTIVDGKWSIVVDKPNEVISQHFTPHNSWGFEGVRAFPQLPHAFRINFNNSEKGFQPDEMIVYNDGYTSSNTTLFETIEFPGVTEPKTIYKHARFHLAQLKLRPETYTLNADIESILCTRGDRVKVVHDVPQWGIDSARVNNVIAYNGDSGTRLVLNESLPMDAGMIYAARIRRDDNTSFVKNVRPISSTVLVVATASELSTLTYSDISVGDRVYVTDQDLYLAVISSDTNEYLYDFTSTGGVKFDYANEYINSSPTKETATTNSQATTMANNLTAMTGYALTAGTTGGTGYSTYWVTNSEEGVVEGSLRWALQQAGNAGGGIVLFEPAGKFDIYLTTQLIILDNITIDAPGRNVNIWAAADVTRFKVTGKNIVIRRLQFGATSDAKTDTLRDSLWIEPSLSDKIWVNECSFHSSGDGCIDITTLSELTLNCRVTVSNCYFNNHDKGSLIGSLACYQVAGQPSWCPTALSSQTVRLFVTMQKNFWNSVGQRQPKVVSQAFVDSINNVHNMEPYVREDGSIGACYGLLTATGGLARSTNDLYIAASGSGYSGVSAVRQTYVPPSVGVLTVEGNGAVDLNGAVSSNGITLDEYDASLVPTTPYTITPIVITNTPTGIDTFISTIETTAGASSRNPKYDIYSTSLPDGYYNTVELVTFSAGSYVPYDATDDNLNPDDLVLFGKNNLESVDLIVQSIEPMDKLSAKLTLVDYSPEIYNSDTEVIPAFDSQITTPPKLLQRVITYKPTIRVDNIVSNETVMEKVGPLSFVYKMFVPIEPFNLLNSSEKIDAAEAEVKLTTGSVWQNTQRIRLEDKGFLFSNLSEQESYDIRVRYVSSSGMVGSWSDIATHTVVGKQTPPQTVNTVTVTAEGDLLRFKWEPNPEIDIVNYEVREDTNFGTSGFLYLGQSPTCTVIAPVASTAKTWYVKAIDSANLYSQTARSINFTVQKPLSIPYVSQKVVKTNRTTVELSVDWADVAPTTYNIAGYEIRLTNSDWGTNTDYVYKGRATSARLTGVDSSTNTTYYIKSFDENNNYSNTAYEFIHDVTYPDTMSSASVSTTRVKSDLRFEILTAPAIPNDFETYEFRVGKVEVGGIPDGTTDNFWDNPNVVVIESTINKASLSLALFDSPRYTNEGLKYRVAVRMRDRSGNYSEASALGSIVVTKIT